MKTKKKTNLNWTEYVKLLLVTMNLLWTDYVKLLLVTNISITRVVKVLKLQCFFLGSCKSGYPLKAGYNV